VADRDGTVTVDAPDTRICFLGDSFVAGVGDPTARGWVGRVTEAGFAARSPFTAYNLGVRGQTGPQTAARVSAEVPPRLSTAGNPRIVVSFGANDTADPVANNDRRSPRQWPPLSRYTRRYRCRC
jgi:acyl-CoA thioesterase I